MYRRLVAVYFLLFFFQIASNNLWHPRRSVLEYLQVMIFANLFAITSNPQCVLDVKDLVLSLLADEQLEVGVFLNSIVVMSQREPINFEEKLAPRGTRGKILQLMESARKSFN